MTSTTAVPSSTPIFPNSNNDVDTLIIHLSETTDLVPLSSVNKAAHYKLKNDVIFKNRFFIEHPLLEKCPKIFWRVHENHPENGWKLACSAMKAKNFFVSLSFIKNSTESIAKSLNSEKGALETSHTQMCGSRYEDPASPIHKAWEVVQRGEQELQEIYRKKQQLVEGLRQTYDSEEELHAALFFLTMDPSIVDLLRNGNEEAISVTNFDTFRQKNVTTHFYTSILHLYALSVKLDLDVRIQRKVIEHRKKLFQETKKQQSICAKDLSDVNSQLQQIEQWTNSLDKNSHHDFFSKIRDKLYQQFAKAKQLEENIECIPKLLECWNLIKTLCEQNEPWPQTDLERVKGLINSCPMKIMTSIWQELYSQRAQGVQGDDQWAENHFAEHLDFLKLFVTAKIIEIQNQQKQFQE